MIARKQSMSSLQAGRIECQSTRSQFLPGGGVVQIRGRGNIQGNFFGQRKDGQQTRANALERVTAADEKDEEARCYRAL